MGLDIGLKKILATEAASQAATQRKLIEFYWTCDIITAWSMCEVVPVMDETMMRIYAEVYNRDLINLNSNQVAQLAHSYKHAIDVFLYQSLFNTLGNIVQRWHNMGSMSKAPVFSIPTNALIAFQNLLTMHKQHPDADNTLEFNAFKSSVANNAEEWFQTWHQDFDISKYLIPQDQFLLFMDFVASKFNVCFTRSNTNDSVAIDYTSKLKDLIDAIKVLLILVHQAKIDTKEDLMKLPSTVFKFSWIPSEVSQEAYQYAAKYGRLKMAHLLCLSSDSQLTFPIQPADTNRWESLEALYAYVKYLQNHVPTEGLTI